MTNTSEPMRSTTAVVIAVGISLLIGAGVTYAIMRAAQNDSPRMETAANESPAALPDMAGMATADPAPADAVVVSLSREAIERAGIVVAPVTAGSGSGAVRLPGVVEPNAYREVIVTPVAGGRITRVNVQLGEEVRRGQTLAQIYSPQLAEAQTRYLSAQADLEAVTSQLRRTARLVEIGAASRQEFEGVRAAHTARATALEGARSQLVLLGMTAGAIKMLSAPSEITATISVPAPLDGIITKRAANVGLNVDPATELFTVVDLSTVWVVGHLYERDFGLVRIGTPAEITTSAYPDILLRGAVSYIDPQLSAETRTARVRVEVRNPERRLRLGMFADMQLGATGNRSTVVVPRDAVQRLGDRNVVYVVDQTQPGQFIEREVALGKSARETVEVVSGVSAGDDVVAQGSFFIRAERERVTPSGRPTAAAPIAPVTSKSKPPQAEEAITVKVTERGFEPARVVAPKGARVRITFIRTTDATCAKEIVVPAQKITRALPLNQPATVELNTERDEVAFACGMHMFKGTVVVK